MVDNFGGAYKIHKGEKSKAHLGIFPYTFLYSFSFIFKKNFIEIELIFNVVIISAVQQSDSIIHIHTSVLFQVFPHTDRHRILA